jgi:hypothetical protein
MNNEIKFLNFSKKYHQLFLVGETGFEMLLCAKEILYRWKDQLDTLSYKNWNK